MIVYYKGILVKDSSNKVKCILGTDTCSINIRGGDDFDAPVKSGAFIRIWFK